MSNGLLERQDQITSLLAAVNAAEAGRGCDALDTGESGIGKTSLIRTQPSASAASNTRSRNNRRHPQPGRRNVALGEQVGGLVRPAGPARGDGRRRR